MVGRRMKRRERNTILAALRYWQAKVAIRDEYVTPEITAIATDGGFTSLNAAEIDGLCEAINMGEVGA